MMKTTAELRTAFLDFFHAQGHEIVPSSSLIPAHDPTLLFTNAGMVQFKDAFLGLEHRANPRAVSCQRCVRAGGKHNDLENVGYTARHHTFFEMLGNFSFGDYFKSEAIRFGWDFLTKTLQLPPERLLVTVYHTDDEAYAIWRDEIGLSAEKIRRIGDKPAGGSDNFWQMGDTGPCGPCTEIFYDHGAHIPGGPPGSPDEDGDRFIEIWNIVFMQYDRAQSGQLTPLPKPSVDTGMGMERLAAILQGVHSNYDIDIFRHLIDAAQAITQAPDRSANSLKVLADHIRSCAFLILDGVRPGNEGRDYVLRRIIRRAARHGHKLGVDDPFFFRLVAPLVAVMGAAYPELTQNQAEVERVLRAEEERFLQTLASGMQVLDAELVDLPAGATIAGDVVFKLYDTHGFPFDLTADIARERGLLLDEAGFEHAMAERRAQSRAASQFSQQTHVVDVATSTCFEGYTQEQATGKIVALVHDGAAVEALEAGQAGVLVLDHTPFYAESGGQVGDSGVIATATGRFLVTDTQKQGANFLHLGEVIEGRIHLSDSADAVIDAARRASIRLNHSATHLLHAALRQVLGAHVHQKGSRVSAESLRFDFSQPEPITDAQLREIEQIVNAQIRENHPVETRELPIDEARAAGAVALFGEKYGDVVRVVAIGPFSMELCGGTHARRGGDLGLIKIVSETGVAAGVRRIEAVTGATALALLTQNEITLGEIAQLVRGTRQEVISRVGQVVARNRELERELAELKSHMAAQAGGDLLQAAISVGDAKFLVAQLPNADANTLRDMVDQLKNKLGTSAVLLASIDDGKVRLIAGVSKDLTGRIKAGDLVNIAALAVGGKGGGRPDMAQAGGTQPEHLEQALINAKVWLEAALSARV
ncbi:MAG: alanine--tRNA ligase [Halothiobacillus sp. 24-54-40]|jgi:alanyl-tRNA synthetase|nr:MAG: alanine--tRNA ligase [Halothiobacillus sp. 20-53-49]OYY40316.1 MAG: alanine--tRNA ligase [Halothiobacillus sp. 35-54-62]OYZ86960.1 MAG: alanine--tRNA ligase [Halothiobacillus sp. 24-54-40]OZA80540.1 MAG: alanine--tRNA ligase [Halothiobacillus sp. 39-53-45]